MRESLDLFLNSGGFVIIFAALFLLVTADWG
jgi:hypothetical protein